MPCRGPDEEPWAINSQQQEKIDKLTRMLCSASKSMELRDVPMSREHKDWWRKHQEWDKKRLEQEREEKRKETLRKNALAKLTKEEKDLLDL